MKKYSVKEIFGPTLQGEGSLNGAVTWFVRFSGCNMWDGRKATRAASACPYCDTDFFGGKMMTVVEIDSSLNDLGCVGNSLVTLSGGEPLLQVDDEFISEFVNHRKVAVETNGTVDMTPSSFNSFECVIISPKVPRPDIRLSRAHDIKVLYPHPNALINPSMFESFPADNYFLQPVNNDSTLDMVNIDNAIAFCLKNQKWRLSLQTHKALGIP